MTRRNGNKILVAAPITELTKLDPAFRYRDQGIIVKGWETWARQGRRRGVLAVRVTPLMPEPATRKARPPDRRVPPALRAPCDFPTRPLAPRGRCIRSDGTRPRRGALRRSRRRGTPPDAPRTPGTRLSRHRAAGRRPGAPYRPIRECAAART